MNRNALTVYAVLRWLSGSKRQLSTTRARIAAECGLHKETISAAMQSLRAGRWLSLRYGRYGSKSWYRITFPGTGFFPLSASIPCGRKKPPQGVNRRPRKTRRMEPGPSGGEKPSLSLKRHGRDAAASKVAAGPRRATGFPNGTEAAIPPEQPGISVIEALGLINEPRP